MFVIYQYGNGKWAEIKSLIGKEDFYFLVHDKFDGWLVGCFWFKGSLRRYFSLYRAVS